MVQTFDPTDRLTPYRHCGALEAAADMLDIAGYSVIADYVRNAADYVRNAADFFTQQTANTNSTERAA